MIWHLLPAISAPMSFQMALDEILFEAAKDDVGRAPVLRFYYSSEPWITTGFSFSPKTTPGVHPRRSLGSRMLRKNPGVPVTKRITGGGCVLHGEDLIFSLIARFEKGGQSPFFAGAAEIFQSASARKMVTGPLLGSVKESYRTVHEAVKRAFARCGFDPKFYEDGESLPKGADCFDFPVASDLLWKGKKIAGGAQKRSGGVLLHHGSVCVPAGLDAAELKAGIRRGLSEVMGVTIEDANLDPELYWKVSKQTADRGLQTTAKMLGLQTVV